MKVLIVGAGVAGPTLAYWLLRAGHEPTLVERAPKLREGGYLIDFWGAGFEVADRMGIVSELMKRGYRIGEVRQVDDEGKRITSFDPELFVRGTDGRYVSIVRSDLAAILHSALGGRVETRFDDTVRALDDDGTRVRVTFESGTPAILECMPGAKTFYFDRVSQIRMPTWTRGRVVLLGDAAACVSLLSGQGTALAMVEAYVLAAELARARGDHAQAFQRYERLLQPLLSSKQKAAEGLASAFAPRTGLQLFVRNSVMKLLRLPGIANLAIGKSLRDPIELPAAPGP